MTRQVVRGAGLGKGSAPPRANGVSRRSAGERGRSLGIGAATTAQLVEGVRAGLPYRAVDHFRRATGLSLQAISELVRIPSRTMSRRKAAGKLRPDESERLLRFATIFENAIELFDGDKAAATRWLRAPQRALGGQPPLEFAKTEVGAREVEDLIGRLEHGVFT